MRMYTDHGLPSHKRAFTRTACTKTAGSGRKLTPFPTPSFRLLFFRRPPPSRGANHLAITPLELCVPPDAMSAALSYSGRSRPRVARDRAQELIGLYHVKRFGTAKLLRFVVWLRIAWTAGGIGRFRTCGRLRTAMVIFAIRVRLPSPRLGPHSPPLPPLSRRRRLVLLAISYAREPDSLHLWGRRGGTFPFFYRAIARNDRANLNSYGRRWMVDRVEAIYCIAAILAMSVYRVSA